MRQDNLGEVEGFDWDKGNVDKNWIKHDVAFWECEEIFANEPLLIHFDDKHSSESEKRFYTLGQTDAGKMLFEVFTVRHNKIRIISARPMSAKEKAAYKEYGKQK
jgi:uncharacterized DUF497 family protein